MARPRTFTVTHKQSITNRMIPQDILYVKKNFLYTVFGWKFSEQNRKIYLYVYNTALIRVMGCFAIPVRINAVLFPLRRIKAHLIQTLYGSYTYNMKRTLVMRIMWYNNTEIIRIYPVKIFCKNPQNLVKQRITPHFLTTGHPNYYEFTTKG